MAEFKPCEGCPDKKKALCTKFKTCLGEQSKKGDKKPVRKGTYG
jgi:hypothetical protein